MPDPSTNSEAVVQAQLDAYNAHDVGAFVSSYVKEAELFAHPAKLLAKGSAQIRERYTARFRDNKLRAVILKRIVLGKWVIDEEEITASTSAGVVTTRAVAIYEVSGSTILRAWFIS